MSFSPPKKDIVEMITHKRTNINSNTRKKKHIRFLIRGILQKSNPTKEDKTKASIIEFFKKKQLNTKE
jgi:hypothetical protein